MAMRATVPRYTLQDLDSFPDDGNRYELVDGILLVTPAPLLPHDVVVMRLIRILNLHFGPDPVAWVSGHGVVEVMPNVHMEPDVLVMPAGPTIPENWLAVPGWWLAVEVSGRGSRIYDREFKRPAYLRAGVREVWRADLEDRCVYVLTPERPEERREAGHLTWVPPAGPGPLVVDVPALFEGVRGDA
jgi:Uma2 family endonuclease